MTSSSLKSAQLKAVNRMLVFNDESLQQDLDDEYNLPPAGSSHNQWKILIYDIACRSIISPLLSVSQLRKRGVTLHLLLNSEREPIPDVPAVYFIRPTKENLSIVASDCSKGLYSRAHLNFVTKLDRHLMEDFARLVVQSGSLQSVASVHDQYLDYICLEQKLFSLSKKNSYVLYNSTSATEQSMEQAMNEIAYGLFSVVASRGQIPVIRCPKGGAPEMVARKLNRMIAEHPTMLRSQNHSRPLLVIMDRNEDLVTPIQHTSTYQALIDDVLDHNANRVEFDVKVEEEGRRPKVLKKKFDLDADKDPFYQNHQFQPFPEAIEQNGVELQDVTQREHAIRSKTVSQQQVQQHTEGIDSFCLANAVDSLPALLDRKKQLEVHTSILQAVMNQVAQRDIPQFYELESSFATGVYKNDLPKAKKDVIALVEDPSKGSVEDKLRVVIVYCLATTAASTEIDEVVTIMQEALETKGITDKNAPPGNHATARGVLGPVDRQRLATGLRAIDYLKKMRSMHMITTMASSELQQTITTSSGGDDMLSSFMARATSQATGLLSKATDRVSSMLGKTHKHRVTQVVENLCEMKPNSEDEEYLYLDPKVKGDVDVRSMLQGMARAPVKDVIAFMIGGGCYAEYQNLQMVAEEGRVVSYGSTELVHPCEFLSQLGQIS